MRKFGLIATYIFIIFLITSLASIFSLGDSTYCETFGYTYAELGFDCSNHVNSFLSSYLGNPQTYFFTISLLLMIILFFHHTPYLKPEYWVRVAKNSVLWVGTKILLTSLSVAVLFYSSFVVAGLILGFSLMWEVQLLFYPLFLFVFSALVMTMFHVVYILSEKYIIALFAFFFTNLIFFAIIDEIAWQMILSPTFVQNFSIFYTIFMLSTTVITLIIALKRKECYK